MVEAGGAVEKEMENSVGRAAKVRDNQGTIIWFQAFKRGICHVCLGARSR